MTSYTSTNPSSGEPRSPLFGTATFSTLSPTQTPYSSSRLSSDRSLTPIGSSYDDTELSSPRQMRRVLVSPSPSSRDSDTYTYSDENSMEDAAEVEAALSMVDDEIAQTEDALTEWSRGSSSVVTSSSYTGQYSATTSATPATYLSGEYRSIADTLLDRDRRVLSTISEHTENPSRPTSFAQSGSGQGSRPNTLYVNPGENRRSANLEVSASPGPSLHARAATDPSGTPTHAQGRVVNVPGRRAGELIAFFEEKQTSTGRDSPRLYGHTRTLSAPMGPRSPAPRSPSPYTTTMSQSMSTFGQAASTTGYGYGSTTGYGTSTYGYSSRPSSPTKSRSGSTVSSSGPITTTSSMFSPPPRGPASLSADSRFPPTSSGTFTQTRSGPSTYTSTGPTATGSYTNTNTFSSSGFTTTATPTASSLRRPQTSPRSPLTSVRNIVAAWKERTPSLGKSVRSNTASPSPEHGEGLFSLRRRAERGSARLRDCALSGAADESGRRVDVGGGYDAEMSTSGDASLSASGVLPPPFDLSELGQFAGAGDMQEPLRIGLLWYLNVHAPPPYRWQRCQALLYPHMLLLSWIAPGGGRGIVTLDLLNCIEVRSVPSPLHPTAQDDVGTIAARMQSDTTGQVGDLGLMETLCPFQLMYSDGIERLGAESARERVRWVSAIWEVLDRAVSIPDRSSTRSPTGSIRTIQSMQSTSSAATSQSGTGSASTVYVPPLDELTEIQSLSGSSSLSRRPSLASANRLRATDDTALSSQGYLYPGDPRVIAPSRSSSLRRTSSLTDLDEEFASALRRAREGRPGLGFGLSLAGGVSMGDGSPVTVSSGPRLGGAVYMSPPPSVGRGSDKRSRGSETSSSVSDDAFFSASSGGSATRTPTSSFYSSSSFTRALTGTETRTGTGTGTGLVTDETIELLSGSGTNIVPSTLSYRGTTSASLLGDSHDSETLTDGLYSSTSPSRSGLTRSGGVRRRTPRSSRTYTTNTFTSDSEGISDKENSNTYSGTYTYTSESYGSRSYTEGLSTLESYSRTTRTTPTRSRSITPTPSSLSYTRSSVDEPTTDSDTEGLTDGATYYTAPTPVPRSPSTASFKSLSTIPSLSDYETAAICDTEYQTAEKCPSERAETEYKTAALCPTPEETEYITADVCASDVSTEFKTAQCRCKEKVPDTDEISLNPPSEIPTIPSSMPSPISREIELELDPADVPLPPSSYSPSEPSDHTPSEHAPTERAPSPPSPPSLTPSSPTEPSISLTPSSPVRSISTPSTMEPSSEELTTESIPGPSPIPPLSDFDMTVSLTISTPTESSVTPTPSSQLTPTVPSTIEQPTTASSPTMPESQWGAESDRSYESSMLRASPSVVSIALPEGPDTSFETSFLRPSGTPQSSEESMLTPITEVSPSSPVTVPSSPSSELTPTQSSLSLLPSVPSPTPIPTDLPRAVTLTRTPSSVSTVSSVSMSSSRIAPSEFELDLATEPSLLSVPTTERTMRPSQPPKRSESVSPLMIPLPPSPAPPTPSASFQVSITTPRGDAPSIASNLETVASDAPSHILTHDVNRLLQYLNEVNDARGAETKEIAENIEDIKNTLEDLEGLLRQRMMPDIPPPVPRKDMSVGGSSVISSDRSSRSARTTPAVPRDIPRIVRAISLSPPPIRIPSPDSLSETMSFLSSHHSDDLSLMESETYPMAGAGSPSWPSSSPISSPESSTISSPTSNPPTSATPSQLSDIGQAIPQARGLTPSVSATPPPLSSSPSPSSLSSDTARPVPQISLGQLRDSLDAIRQQIASMLDGQHATNRCLDDLRDRSPAPMPVDHFGELSDRLQAIEDSLARLLDRGRAGPPPPPPVQPEEDVSAVDSDASSLLRRLRDAQAEARSRDQPTIHAPIARAPIASFDEQLMDILMTNPPQAQAPVGPPPLIPLIYRPGPRPRPRSASPVFDASVPERPGTFPQTQRTMPFEGRRARRPQRPPQTRPPPAGIRVAPEGVQPSETESMADAPPPVIPVTPGPGARPVSGPDIDFDERVREHRDRRRPGTGGWFQTETDAPARPATAPVPGDTGAAQPEGSWYQPAQPAQPAQPEPAPGTQMPVPPPGQFSQPQSVPPPTMGPTVVQLPSTFDDILTLLRDNRDGQGVSIAQQREVISYLTALNRWLERDVHDRHAEIQSVSARLEATREEVLPLLHQIAQTLRREGPPGAAQQAGGQTTVIPPVVAPGQSFPEGFVPIGSADRPAVWPQERTPPPVGGPVIPPPGGIYGPSGPVFPSGGPPMPMPQMQPQGQTIIVPTEHDSPEVVPRHPDSFTDSGSRSSSPRSRTRSPEVHVIPVQEGLPIMPPGMPSGMGPGMAQPHVTVVQPPPPTQQPTVVEVAPSGAHTYSSRPGSPSRSGHTPEESYEGDPGRPHAPPEMEADAGHERPSHTTSHVSRPASPRDYADGRSHPTGEAGPAQIHVHPAGEAPSQVGGAPTQPPTPAPIIIQPSPPVVIPAGGGPPAVGYPPQQQVPQVISIRGHSPSRSRSSRTARDDGYSRSRSRHSSHPRQSPSSVTAVAEPQHPGPAVIVGPPQPYGPTMVPTYQPPQPLPAGTHGEPQTIVIQHSHSRSGSRHRDGSYRSGSRDRYRDRPRSGSRDRYRDRPRSGSRDRYRDRPRSRDRYRDRPRSRDRYRDRPRSRDRYRDRYRGRPRYGSRSRDSDRDRSRPPYYSRSRSYSPYGYSRRRGERLHRRPDSRERDPRGRRYYVRHSPGGRSYYLDDDLDRPRREYPGEGRTHTSRPRSRFGDAGEHGIPSTSHPGEHYPEDPGYQPTHSAEGHPLPIPTHIRPSSPRYTEGDTGDHRRPRRLSRSPPTLERDGPGGSQPPQTGYTPSHPSMARDPRVPRETVPTILEVGGSRTPSPTRTEHDGDELYHGPTASRPGTAIGTRPPGIPRTAEQDLRDQLRGPDDIVIPTMPPSVPFSEAGDPELGHEPLPATITVRTPPTERPFTPRPASPAQTHYTPRSPSRPLPTEATLADRPLSGPGDITARQNEEERQRIFEDLRENMERILDDAQEEEMKRDENYKANEGERQRAFEASEERREQEAQARHNAIWDELENRLNALPLPPQTEGALPVPPPGTERPADIPGPEFESEEPPPPPPGESPPQSVVPVMAPDTEALIESMRQAAARHADDIREVVDREREQLVREREEAQAERERAQAEAAAEKERMHEEYQAHIRALESELGAVRKELEDEKLSRQAEEAERRETERAEMLERDEAMRNQLSDITNIVSEQRDELARKRELADERWEVKQGRWEQKDAEDAQTRNMLQQLLEGQAAMLAAQAQSKEELVEEMRANQRAALDAIEQQRAAYEGTIRDMAEAWRADCEQRKQETIEAVKATANEQVPYNVQGYLDEFSRSLATEVRMLLSEVGKLREDKRNLEYQIGELLQFKSKYGPGGEFDPSWKPAMTCVPTDGGHPEPAPPAPEPEPEVPQQAPSAWRSIHPRGSRRSRRTAAAAPPPPPPEPAPQTQSWATWQPNPAFQPSPPPQQVEHLLAPPQGSPGLFGPRSPRDSIRG